MYLLKAVIDFFVILLLIRLLIRPNEAYFDPIYRLIYRITDPVLVPARYVTSRPGGGILLILSALVIMRGFLYTGLGSATLTFGVGKSFLDLFQLLFQAYMVMWFVSLLSQHSFGNSFLNLIQRAFLPLHRISARFGIQRRTFHLFSFLFLWVSFSLLSTLVRYVMAGGTPVMAASLFLGFVEGIWLVIALFPFPGFFSVIIIAGALLSWVSPDPSNPIVQAVYGISEPLLAPFRRFVPLIGGIDVSPIAALLCFQIVGSLAVQVIAGLMKGGLA
ncbi:MAG: YggT family protein [Deltaproteobacteria bacterium]|nr:YggT family protein [Deltaproteobacteria bacterium]